MAITKTAFQAGEQAPVSGAGLVLRRIIDSSWWVLLGLCLILAGVAYFNFLLFHTLAELFVIIVAAILAVVAWHTYAFSRNHFLMYVGIGYFWVAVIDLFHALTFKGMAIIATADANTSIQFWIVARFIEALVLLSAPLFFHRRIPRYTVMLLLGMGSSLLLFLGLQRSLPDMYLDGEGLTQAKIVSEYLIIALLLAALVVFTRMRAMIDQRIYWLMALSIIFTILAELSFTLYLDVYSVSVFIGHVFKLVSFWLIFVAVVKTTLTEPYQILTRASSTYDAVPDATLVVDPNGRITQVNRAAEQQAGRSRALLLEKNCHELFHPPEVERQECLICNCIESGRALANHEVTYPDSGKVYEVTLTPYEYMGEVKGMVHVQHDISDKKFIEQQLLHSANYDPLTDFPNRSLAQDRLEQAIRHARRFNMHTAVIFVDVDNFKNINDTLGHVFGDKVLIRMAQALIDCVRQSDTVARWGGDEFLILVPGLQKLEDVERVLDKIFERLSRPLSVDGREFIMSVSIGIAGYPDDGSSADLLLSNADAAMYLAKQAGRNTWRFYTAGMNERAAERLELEARLRKALANQEFSLVYQPKLDLLTGKVFGAEALLRWHNPELGNVTPDRFIPLAESSGLIVPIGEWVLRQVCSDLRDWLDRGLEVGQLALNISSHQIRAPGFAQRVEQILRDYAIAPQQLEIEITESVLLGEDRQTLEVLQALRKLGLSISLDDFGTGYSSLSYLKRFPFTALKIDQSFIRDLESDPGDLQLCKAMIAMAESLKLQVVGEGVETAAQQAILRDLGVAIVQGFLYSRPLPAADFLQWIAQQPAS